MKCETCRSRGFTELEHGLIMVGCGECNGTGEIEDDKPIENGDDLRSPNGDDLSHPTTSTGLLFQLAGKRTDEYSEDKLWLMAKKEAEEKELWPHIVRMPCGNEQRFDSFLNLPIEDIPCPCGNPNHYIVQFSDVRKNAWEEAIGNSAHQAEISRFEAENQRVLNKHQSIGRVVLIQEGEGCLDVVAELSEEGVERLGKIGIKDDIVLKGAKDKLWDKIITPKIEGIDAPDDIDSRTGQPDTASGSADTSQPKQPKKLKAKKRARKGTG